MAGRRRSLLISILVAAPLAAASAQAGNPAQVEAAYQRDVAATKAKFDADLRQLDAEFDADIRQSQRTRAEALEALDARWDERIAAARRLVVASWKRFITKKRAAGQVKRSRLPRLKRRWQRRPGVKKLIAAHKLLWQSKGGAVAKVERVYAEEVGALERGRAAAKARLLEERDKRLDALKKARDHQLGR